MGNSQNYHNKLSEQLSNVINSRVNIRSYNSSIYNVKQLIKRGADVNRPHDGLLPLHFACYCSDTLCLRVLLDNGAEVNKVDDVQQTALHFVANIDSNSTSCVEFVDVLIEHGSDINARDRSKGTPLYWAIDNYDVDCVKRLLYHGADVNIRGYKERTPLHCAVKKKKFEFVKHLLRHGANVDDANSIRNTALSYAAWHCSVELIKVLLDYGANVNTINLDRKTPLMRAAIEPVYPNTRRFVECVELLIEASGQFDLRDENGEIRSELSEMLLPYCVSPRSLQVLCRYQIRSSLRNQFLPDVIPSLNLPQRLQRFVLLQR